MFRGLRVSATFLSLACVLGAVFFVLTDPRAGLVRAGTDQNAVDLIAWHSTGTIVGLVGCAILLAMGVYLFSKRVA